MNRAELISAVEKIVDDPSYDGGIIGDLLNDGMSFIAGKVSIDELDATDTVDSTANAAFVALPADYKRGLYFVGSSNQSCKIGNEADYKSFRKFLRRYPDPALDKDGSIESVSIKGSNLYYQPREVDTLTLHYFRKPATLTDVTDEPELPDHLHRALLVNYACREIYREIEDGIEDKTVNTDKHDRLFNRALSDLMAFVGVDADPEFIDDEADSIYV